MMKPPERGQGDLPTARKIRRACNRELYRAVKKMNVWIPGDKLAEAEKYYFEKVVQNLKFVFENSSNRKKLADWWDENVCNDIAGMWNVNPQALAKAFRESFGG